METKENTPPTAPSTPTATPSAEPQKVPRKLRGTLTIKAQDDMEFRADRTTGLSSQEEISHDGPSKLYRTVGEKRQTMVLHAVAPTDCADPRAYFYECVERLTEGMQTKARARLRGIRLMRQDDLDITYNKGTRTIEATLRIELERTPDYNSRLINLMQRISQCFATNQTTFRRPRK